MTTAIDTKLAGQVVKTVKFLAVDAVEQANSGHPGMPMGAADMACVLWSRFLRYDPSTPEWPDRDRFVLSAGHGCMLLYSMLHLSGYELSMEELKRFRQWGSLTPGHPEFDLTPGVEATTGPLGQGVGNAIGMALARRMLADRFNSGGNFKPINHRIFTIASDGDLMEGVSGEASSLAGHLGLGDLVVLYDDNRITIEGETSLAFSENVTARYESYGWHVDSANGHDHDAIAAAIDKALAQKKPALIACRTHIAHGAPTKQDTAGSHGSPLGEEETKAAKEKAGWPADKPFHVPEPVRDFFRARAEEGTALRTAWEQGMQEWKREDGDRAHSWDAIWRRSKDITKILMKEAPTDAGATRAHGGKVAAGRSQADAGAGGRLGRPRTLDQDRHQGVALDRAGRVRRAQLPLRRPRARDGRDRQRDALPRRLPALWCDLSRLLRLHASVDPPLGADAPAGDLDLHARLDLRRRGTARRTSRSSTSQPSG